MYFVWKNLRLACFCISSSFEFHVHQERCAIKTGCQAARPCLIIQQFTPIFVILCLHALDKLHCALDPMTGERKSLLYSTKKRKKKKRKEKNTHGHFALLLVTSWHIFLSFFREKQKKMQKLASKEDEDKRRIQTETNWQAKTVNQGRERGICFQRSVWVQCVTDKSSHTLFKTKLKRHQIHLHMSSKKKRQFLSTWGHKVYQLFSTPKLCLLLLGL